MSEALVEPTGDASAVEQPQDWDKAVSAAYFRALGATQAASAEAAGVSERTLRAWENSAWWPQATREAVERWHTDLSAASRKSLLDAVKTDGDLALKVQERLNPRLSSKEITVARVQALLTETVRVIREELDEETATRVLQRVREVWR